jgi:alpha-glucuronidase
MLPTFLLWVVAISIAAAEQTGLDAWLQYTRLPGKTLRGWQPPARVIALNSTESGPVYTAGLELQRGLYKIIGERVVVSNQVCTTSSSVLIGTVETITRAYGTIDGFNENDLAEDGFWLKVTHNMVEIIGRSERGALYGAFEYLSMIAQGNFSEISYLTNPSAPVRWANEWDNMDGTIERGYGGPSIFFANKTILPDLTRAAQWARLLASVRINGIILTNVNADPVTLTPANIQGVGRIADAMRPYGVQVGLALNFASPQTLGNLSTYDPLDQSVITWWTNITNQIYHRVPDFAGYLLKANSEGQPGPLTYNRTLAQGANMFAKAVKPHGGVIMFRAFVYHQLNITDWKSDRAAAAYEAFRDLDGAFDDNVIVQIKYGPLDFQVREPPHPLFGFLKNTNVAIELQVSQEYTGQQSHTVYLPPLWKTILDADIRVDGQTSLVRDIISGKRFSRPLSGYAAVINAGNSSTWLGSHFAMSNVFAYGHLAWNPVEDITCLIETWSRLTFGLEPRIAEAVSFITMNSWPAYLNYSSGNLGLPTLTDVTYNHFGPNIRSQDNNGWGIWTRSDSFSIGMDRSVANGTAFTGQYAPELAAIYENMSTTPDELLLWFHHVNYTYRLHSGKTVIQHIYDAHYEGANTAQLFPKAWESLQTYMQKDLERYEEILFQLKFQAGHSIVWRDSVCDYYHNLSGIPDAANRVGFHPWRIEAEKMRVQGYKEISTNPIEASSNSLAISAISNATTGVAYTKLDVPPGKYDIAAVYFDLSGGVTEWQILLNDRQLGTWLGNNEQILGHAASDQIDGGSKTRVTFRSVELQGGDNLTVVGKPDRWDIAALDYIAVLPLDVID